ncbi:hypothetical protein PssvBMR18_gp55 [Pseudomonas phage MR18]|nr:hypothetical protein PssvBMR18_gp55 [Pseudomonas phage MR18]
MPVWYSGGFARCLVGPKCECIGGLIWCARSRASPTPITSSLPRGPIIPVGQESIAGRFLACFSPLAPTVARLVQAVNTSLHLSSSVSL